MRRDFVANVSHELRTPLTVLVGFLETVRELKLDPQRVRDYIGMMREQAARMHRIIEDLLALSVLESAPPPTAERVRIAPDHIPRLTERFYRVDRSRSRETGGTGLGLAIVKHALARHQASLEIASTPGSGSRFSAHFPASRTVPLEAATPAAAQ